MSNSSSQKWMWQICRGAGLLMGPLVTPQPTRGPEVAVWSSKHTQFCRPTRDIIVSGQGKGVCVCGGGSYVFVPWQCADGGGCLWGGRKEQIDGAEREMHFSNVTLPCHPLCWAKEWCENRGSRENSRRRKKRTRLNSVNFIRKKPALSGKLKQRTLKHPVFFSFFKPDKYIFSMFVSLDRSGVDGDTRAHQLICWSSTWQINKWEQGGF